MDRWTLEDLTDKNKGFCRVLLDCFEIGVDVFPYKKGGDPEAIKNKAVAMIEVLNAANCWRHGGDGLGSERLEDAVDALNKLNIPNLSKER